MPLVVTGKLFAIAPIGHLAQLLGPNILAEYRGALLWSADFRRRDMAVGGRCTEFVPAFHQRLVMIKRLKVY